MGIYLNGVDCTKEYKSAFGEWKRERYTKLYEAYQNLYYKIDDACIDTLS